MDPWLLLALVAGGFVGGVVNAFAGGGSFITFPLLMLAGLSPQVANATNRVGVILQCLGGLATYHAHGVLPWRDLRPLVIPALLGAIPGTLLASRLDPDRFRQVTAVLLVLVVLMVFVDPKRWVRKEASGRIRRGFPLLVFVLGLYGGFLQVGIGNLLLALFVLLGGYDVVRGNALKFGISTVYMAAALAIFASSGQVEWVPGLVLGLGNIAGGAVGALGVVKKGAKWVPIVVVLSALAGVIKLVFAP